MKINTCPLALKPEPVTETNVPMGPLVGFIDMAGDTGWSDVTVNVWYVVVCVVTSFTVTLHGPIVKSEGTAKVGAGETSGVKSPLELAVVETTTWPFMKMST
jgi:hypothetical protein